MARTVIEKFYQKHPAITVDKDNWWRLLTATQLLFEPNGLGVFLDIGCHNGDKTVALGRYIDAEVVVGIDFDGPPLTRARSQGVQTVAIDLNQDAPLPFPAASFDCIHMGEVIEHVFSPDLLLAEIVRLLKPGGYAVITTPNLASWRNRLVLLFGWQPFGTEVSTEIRVGNPRAAQGTLAGHIRLFTPRALTELAKHYNLRVERVAGWAPGDPATPFAYILAVVDRLVQKYFPTLCDGMLIKVRRG